jgi:hypothetical protein
LVKRIISVGVQWLCVRGGMAGGGSRVAPAEASSTEYSLTQPADKDSSDSRRFGRGALLVFSALMLLLLPHQLWQGVRTAELTAEPAPVDGWDGAIDFKKQPPDEVAEMAYVILIRHGEKGSKQEVDSNGLSPTGMKRAEYLARCMSDPSSSLALPAGPPKYVLASHTKPEKSHRAFDTAMPLARKLGLTVHDKIHVSHRKCPLARWPDAAQLPRLARALLRHSFRCVLPNPIAASALHPSPTARRPRTTRPSCRRSTPF